MFRCVLQCSELFVNSRCLYFAEGREGVMQDNMHCCGGWRMDANFRVFEEESAKWTEMAYQH